MRFKSRWLVAGLVLIWWSSSVTLANEQKTSETLAELKRLVDAPDERVSVLDNGLTVILKAHRTAPVATVRMYCRTGSIYEQEYLGCGLSHLFEHLLHGGETVHRKETESRRIIEELGGNSNAYTSFDVTCYYIDTAREDVDRAVELLADWITHPTWPQEAFEREWAVVQRELERDVDDPARQLFYLTTETMYLEHPIRYPIIGYKPVVQSLSKDDIVSYYERMYVPDNIVVCIVGDIDLDRTLADVSRRFAGFTRRKMPTITLPDEPEMATPRSAIKHMNVEAAYLRLAWPTIPLTHPDLYALDVLSYVLTQGDSSRLARTVRDEGLVYTIDSFSWTPQWARGMFAVTSRLETGKITEAKKAILEQIERLKHDLISEEELSQAKKQKAAEHVFASQTAESVASMVASDYLSTGDIHFSEAYVDNIQSVTAEGLREMARKYLVPQRLGTIMIVPPGGEVDTQEAVDATGPEPVRRIVLDNGLRCLIRRDPTTPLVAMQIFSLGGVAFEDEKTTGLSQLAASLAPRGTKTRDAQEIARYFDSRGGYLNGAAGNNTLYFRASVLSEDFPGAIEVFADVVREPTFPESELAIFRERQLDEIRRVNEQWRSELFAYFKSRFYTDSPYRFLSAGTEEVITSVTRQQVEAFYHRCVTARNSVVAIYGDVNVSEAEAMLRRHFGPLPAGDMLETPAVNQRSPESPELYIKAKGPDRKAAGLCIGFGGMKITDVEDTVPTAVLDTIISGYRLPTGWLHESLRGGNRSFVYEVHAINQPGLVPGSFHAYAACEPASVEEVYRIMTEQFDKARRGEFNDDELARAKVIIRTTELMQYQTNSERAMQASLDELYGLGHDHHDTFGERVDAVTLEDVRRVADKYLREPVVVVVTPAPDQVPIGIEPASIDRDSTDDAEGN